jgi:Asp-tRNA(Asn)/Glu-tRNA(Gln) amidotransferase A subunit family amidase
MPSTLHAAADEIRTGRRTPIDLLEACLERIDRLEERIHAWVFVDHKAARAEAERLSAEQRNGTLRGPLHGIPIGIKDIFDVRDWPTAAGSRLWKDNIARRDATVVHRLRHAGAIFLGKTVTTQYASFDPPPTRNPWDLSRTPGGSSSGSAAALACGMCLGALGSQTGGSITRPASYCGVAGLKPNFGRVSTQGVLPLAASMDHVGAMARCVRDLEILYQTIADPKNSKRAPAWLPSPLRGRVGVGDVWLPFPTRGEGAKPAPTLPPRLGRLLGFFENRADASVLHMMDEACDRFRSHGAVLTEEKLPAEFAGVTARHRTVMAVEAARYHRTRLRDVPHDYDPNIRALLEEGLACPALEYAWCKEAQLKLREAMRACFTRVDALLTPATPGPAPDAATTGDPVFNSPWSYTGLPTVCFPAGRSPEGLPLGVQLVGAPWSENGLLAIAAWCENVLGFEIGEPTV